MRERFTIGHLLPFFCAVVIYVTISLLYFAPQLSGAKIVQGDITQYKGMTQDIIETRERVGEDPQWSGSMFGGMPAYLINVEYPGQVIKRIGSAVTGIVDTPAAFIIFAMLSMWLMLVMMGVNGYVAIIGGAAYGLSTYFMLIIEAGHVTKMWALVYAPAMMGAIFVALRSGRLWSYPLVALFTSLELGANHPQISYYFLMAAGALYLSELYFAYQDSMELREFGRRTGLLLAAGVLALLSNLSPLWYTAEHTPETMRAGSELAASSKSSGLDLEYATAWSYGRGESLNLLIPDFTGRDSAMSFSDDGKVANALEQIGINKSVSRQLPTYWGTQPFTAGPTYLGAVVLFLAVLGFALSSGRERWWLLSISVVMLLLSWGSNLMWFTELMFRILPGYDKFRTVSMTLVVVQWSVPLLACYALSKLWHEEVDQQRLLRSGAWAFGLTAGVALVVAFAGGILFDYGYTESFKMLLGAGLPEDISGSIAGAMVAERGDMIASDAIRSALYITISAGAILLFGAGKITRWVMLVVVGGAAIIDLVAVDMRFLNYDDFQSPRSTQIIASPTDRLIMADKGESGDREYRVFNLSVSPFNDATTSYHHRSIGGYHGAKLARYQDLIDKYLVYQNPSIFDMLNTRYVISPESDEPLLRESAFGPAWFVGGVRRVSTPDEEIARLGEVDLRTTAVVAEGQDMRGGNFSNGSITMEEYMPHYQRYRYSAEGPATAIFSEVYYTKGWSAYVDGVEAPYFRANYILRAMELPEGEHTVEWRFRAPRWGVINFITLLSSLVILLSAVGALAYEFKNKR
ncbi:MAG: hypothetical protein R3Y16_01425 [Rikenellaceae bacterium]